MGRVGGGRDERGQLVDADPAADVLEVAALLERVHERDRVHRFALRVQVDGGLVDLLVALPVEVGGPKNLPDRVDRTGGKEHRAEHAFLGFEVLRRDRSAVGDRGQLSHQRGFVAGQPGAVQDRLICRGREHMFVPLSPAQRTSSPNSREVVTRISPLGASKSAPAPHPCGEPLWTACPPPGGPQEVWRSRP